MTEKLLHPNEEKSWVDMTTDEITKKVQAGIKNAELDPKVPPVTYLDPTTGKLITEK